MATVNKAIRQYLESCTSIGKQSSLSRFISKNEDICLDFIEQFNTADDAQKNLTRRYSTLHKSILTRKGTTGLVHWTRLYEKAKTREDLRIAAMRGIRMAIPLALNDLQPGMAATGKGADTDTDTDTHTSNDEDDYDGSIIKRDVLLAWKQYVAESTVIARRKGLSIVNDLQRLLSLSNVMLLKPKQHDPAFAQAIGEEQLTQLHDDLRSRFLDKRVKVDDKLFMAIKDIVEDMIEHKDKRARLTAKRKLMQLDFDTSDIPIIDIVFNCISGLQSFVTDSVVGELELITSYLDPILRPLLRDPDEMRLLRWTNRTCTELEYDYTKRPDGAMTLQQQFHGASALGFCEVKPADSSQNADLCFTDLLRLGLFAKSGIDKGEIQATMVVHAIGPVVTFYMMQLTAPGFYPLVELTTISVPQTIDDLAPFLMKLSLLKRVHLAYHMYSKALDPNSRVKLEKWKMSSFTDEELAHIINITSSKDKSPHICV